MNQRSLLHRLTLGAGVGVVATIAYRSIQFLFLSRATVRSECWSWNWLPFDAAWIWPYWSMFILVGLPWLLLPTLEEVRRFGFWLLAIAAVGWVTFMVYPTATARPSADGQPWFFALQLSLDGPNNCIPCLHAAFSLFAMLTLAQRVHFFRNATGMAVLGVWLMLISVSIVALRQHTGIDALAGFGLGGLGFWGFSTGKPVFSANAAHQP